MSGVAVASGLDATGGLVPRYLRRRERDAEISAAADAAAAAAAKLDPFSACGVQFEPRPPGMTLTAELRRRIAEASPAPRPDIRPILVGVAAVGVLLVVGFAIIT